MKVELDWSDLDRELSVLYAHGANLNDLRPIIGETLVTAIDEVFENEGGATEGKWIESQRAKRQGGKTLQDSGIMAGSVGYDYPETGAVAAGANVPYDIFALEGTKNAPKRDFLDIDWDQVTDEIAEFLVGEVLM